MVLSSSGNTVLLSMRELSVTERASVSQAQRVAWPSGGSPVSVGRNVATSGSSSGRQSSGIMYGMPSL